MAHCERHLKVAPIIEPSWWLLHARQSKETYDTYKQKAEKSAEKLQIRLSIRLINMNYRNMAIDAIRKVD
jgi:hypothetical protein